MSVGPIPLTEISAYFTILEIDDIDLRARYLRMIRALDEVWLQEISGPDDSPKRLPPKPTG